MALRAEYEIGCDALPLVDVAAAVPDARVTLRIGASRDGRPPFVVRVSADGDRVDAVVLVLTGTEGPEFLRESAGAVHEALPESRFVDFDGVSHSGPSEAPARTAEELRAFLAD